MAKVEARDLIKICPKAQELVVCFALLLVVILKISVCSMQSKFIVFFNMDSLNPKLLQDEASEISKEKIGGNAANKELMTCRNI